MRKKCIKQIDSSLLKNKRKQVIKLGEANVLTGDHRSCGQCMAD